jgi:Zn-dependent peptidase ImmA (M78 family)
MAEGHVTTELQRKVREYLTGDLREEAEKILASFTGLDPGDSAARDSLSHFVVRALRFARLERVFQGDIHFDLPVHFELVRGELGGDPVTDGWRLAEEERRAMGVGLSPLDELHDILDTKGIKILAVPAPFPAAAFLFREETGPALMVTASPDSPEGRAALAHAYAHLVADVSPYRNRFCPLGTRLRAEAEELRAEAFARALLLPDAVLPESQRLSDLDRARLARAYGVPESLVVQRWHELREPERRWGLSPREVPPQPEPRKPPERFLNLVLAAYVKGWLTREGMSLYLEADEAQIRQLLAWVEEKRPRGGEGREDS